MLKEVITFIFGHGRFKVARSPHLFVKKFSRIHPLWRRMVFFAPEIFKCHETHPSPRAPLQPMSCRQLIPWTDMFFSSNFPLLHPCFLPLPYLKGVKPAATGSKTQGTWCSLQALRQKCTSVKPSSGWEKNPATKKLLKNVVFSNLWFFIWAESSPNIILKSLVWLQISLEKHVCPQKAVCGTSNSLPPPKQKNRRWNLLPNKISSSEKWSVFVQTGKLQKRCVFGIASQWHRKGSQHTPYVLVFF